MQAVFARHDKMIGLSKVVQNYLHNHHDVQVKWTLVNLTDKGHPAITFEAPEDPEDGHWVHVNQNGAGSVPNSELYIVVRYENGLFIDDIDETPLGETAHSAIARMRDLGYFDVC